MKGADGFFDDPKGKRSLHRLLAFLAFVAAAVIAVSVTVRPGLNSGLAPDFVWLLLAYSLGHKVGGAAIEQYGAARNFDQSVK